MLGRSLGDSVLARPHPSPTCKGGVFFALLGLLAWPFAVSAQLGIPILSGRIILDRDAWAGIREAGLGQVGPQVPVEVRIVCDGKTFASIVADTGGTFRIPLQAGIAAQRNGMRLLTRAGVAGCDVRVLLPGFHAEPRKIAANRSFDLGFIVLLQSKGFTGSVVSANSSNAPKEARKLFEEALVDLRRRNFDRASETLHRAVELYPGYAEAWYDIAAVEEATDTLAARESYRKAIAANPAYVFSYRQLLRLEVREALWDQAFDTATQILKLCPHDYPEGWYDLAFAAHQLGKYREAEQSALSGIAEDPDRSLPELERLMGTILFAKGDRAGSVEHWGNYLRLSPAAPDLGYIQNQLSAMSPAAHILAEGGRPIADVVALVRAALQTQTKDEQLAARLNKIVLAEQLDDRTIETLASEGAGAQTVAELERLRDESVRRPIAPSPAIPSPAAPSPEEQDRIWDAAADNSLGYTASLPNFICSEVVRRYLEPAERPYDTLEMKLTYFGQRENYELIRINGSATHLTYDQAGGATTKGEFGSTLTSTFGGGAAVEHEWDHWTTLRKRPTYVYFFRTSLTSSTYKIEYRVTAGERLYSAVASQNGYVYIDAETHRVVRISWEAENIPVSFPVQSASTRLDYDFADIAGGAYLLPMAAEVRIGSPSMDHRNEVEFRDYKKFAADTNITFGSVKK